MSKETLEPIDYTSIKVACQLCGKWLRIWEYDSHYEKCLDIEYLVSVAKEHEQDITREDLEQYVFETAAINAYEALTKNATNEEVEAVKTLVAALEDGSIKTALQNKLGE